MIDSLYCITLRQPWAWAMACLDKRIENRVWIPRRGMHGKPIAIHAGQAFDDDGARWLWRRGLLKAPFPPGVRVRGAVVAVATFDRVVSVSNDPWFTGPVGWVFSACVALPSPVPCRGQLGLWLLPEDVRVEVLSQMPIREEQQ
jgi:hypothetical protein